MSAEALDWLGTVVRASRSGLLMELLVTLPRARWSERDPLSGCTLLHYSCLSAQTAATEALLRAGVDVNVLDVYGRSATHFAVMFQRPRALELLCAAGAALRTVDVNHAAPLELAVCLPTTECARVFVANGMRLHTVGELYSARIAPDLWSFERGVLCCRAAVIAMIRVKRAGKLVVWDQFLLKAMALCVWATRSDVAWHKG